MTTEPLLRSWSDPPSASTKSVFGMEHERPYTPQPGEAVASSQAMIGDTSLANQLS